ncbi:MAG: TauD/TfdA family dioxygenase [Myxococcota bacterium]|nr:TauD/TfdA family dioxygenase [Myxococcota bacterium]
MGSNLCVEPLEASFGARVTGLSLTDASDAAFKELYRLWLEYALLIFPAQHMAPEDQVIFARRFGGLEIELAALSNLRGDGSVRDDVPEDEMMQILKGNMGWHADSTYMPVQAKGAVFSAHRTPRTGGATAWADMGAAYAALAPGMRARIEGLAAHHSLIHSQTKIGHAARPAGESEGTRNADDYNGYGFHDDPPPLRALIKVHPETGQPGLLIGRHAFGIPGLAPAESEALLDELIDFACQPPRIYEHDWAAGDTVVWDNRCLLHRGRPWDMAEPRVMYHSRIAGDPVTESAMPS